jgi:peptidoglycan hydrolase CwlO-like protein
MLVQHNKGDTMPTDKKLEQQVEKLTSQVNNLTNSNSQLLDEVETLKSNYSRLVEDISARFETVHEKIFR